MHYVLVGLSPVEAVIPDPNVTYFWGRKAMLRLLCWSAVQTSPSRAHHTRVPPATVQASPYSTSRLYTWTWTCSKTSSTIQNQLPVPSLLTAQTPFPIELHRSNKAYSLLVHIKLPTREVQMEKSLSLGKRVEFGIRGLWIRRLDTGLHISSRTSIPTF